MNAWTFRAFFRRSLALLLALALAAPLQAQSLPASPVALDDASIAALEAGGYLWAPETAPPDRCWWWSACRNNAPTCIAPACASA